MENERRTTDEQEENRSQHEPQRTNAATETRVREIAEQLAVSREDVLDAIEQVGDDPAKIEEMLRGRENSY